MRREGGPKIVQQEITPQPVLAAVAGPESVLTKYNTKQICISYKFFREGGRGANSLSLRQFKVRTLGLGQASGPSAAASGLCAAKLSSEICVTSEEGQPKNFPAGSGQSVLLASQFQPRRSAPQSFQATALGTENV